MGAHRTSRDTEQAKGRPHRLYYNLAMFESVASQGPGASSHHQKSVRAQQDRTLFLLSESSQISDGGGGRKHSRVKTAKSDGHCKEPEVFAAGSIVRETLDC